VSSPNFMQIPIEAYWEQSPHRSGFTHAVCWCTGPDRLPIPRRQEPPVTRLHDRLDQGSPPVSELTGKEWTRDSSLRNQRRGFTAEEDELLIELRSLGLTWPKIANVFQQSFTYRSQHALQQRWSKRLQHSLPPQRSARQRSR
jgi:hypothetical protein